MKILKLKFILLVLLIPFGTSVLAQNIDCASRLNMRKATPPYKVNKSLSKSAQCLTGKTYTIKLPLSAGREYRISFYASPVFNNNMHFKIIDENENKVVLDIPGEVMDYDKKGSCALRPYTDPETGKSVHPYFSFYPENSTQLKIIIEIPSIKQEDNGGNIQGPEERKRGCVTVFVQDKKTDAFNSGGFEEVE